MYQPETYGIALTLMLITMFAWGSWANTLKLAPKLPFQLAYWDYVLGVLLASLVWGFSLGSIHPDASSFAANLQSASTQAWLYALAGGAVFNVANLLLVAAIEVAGLAVAFPVGIGLALVVGVAVNYFIAPKGQPILLCAGVALVLAAIVIDALAYKKRGDGASHNISRGIKLALACGVLMGSFYPLVTKAGNAGLGPYAVAFVFGLGVLACAIPVNAYLMKRPLTGAAPVGMARYFAAPVSNHIWALIGGLIWGTGTIFSIVAGHAALVGPAVSYAIGQGATMVSALWGVFVWREFAGASPAARKLLPPMFLLFLAGLGLIAIAPLY